MESHCREEYILILLPFSFFQVILTMIGDWVRQFDPVLPFFYYAISIHFIMDLACDSKSHKKYLRSRSKKVLLVLNSQLLFHSSFCSHNLPLSPHVKGIFLLSFCTNTFWIILLLSYLHPQIIFLVRLELKLYGSIKDM